MKYSVTSESESELAEDLDWSPQGWRYSSGEGCGERKCMELGSWVVLPRESVAGLGGPSGPVGILPFNFVVVCTTCAFLE